MYNGYLYKRGKKEKRVVEKKEDDEKRMGGGKGKGNGFTNIILKE